MIQENLIDFIQNKIGKNKPGCSLCSRLRRGILYHTCLEKGFNKLALGHHANDAIETLFMNLFYTGRMASMSPKILAENGKINVIRPLILLDEEEILSSKEYLSLPVSDCNLCPVMRNRERAGIKNWIKKQSMENPYFIASLKKALSNVQPRHLWDTNLWNFLETDSSSK